MKEQILNLIKQHSALYAKIFKKEDNDIKRVFLQQDMINIDNVSVVKQCYDSVMDYLILDARRQDRLAIQRFYQFQLGSAFYMANAIKDGINFKRPVSAKKVRETRDRYTNELEKKSKEWNSTIEILEEMKRDFSIEIDKIVKDNTPPLRII